MSAHSISFDKPKAVGIIYVEIGEEIEIEEYYESVVTKIQTIDGVLTVTGRNTII